MLCVGVMRKDMYVQCNLVNERIVSSVLYYATKSRESKKPTKTNFLSRSGWQISIREIYDSQKKENRANGTCLAGGGQGDREAPQEKKNWRQNHSL